jgi:hypothetical protein
MATSKTSDSSTKKSTTAKKAVPKTSATPKVAKPATASATTRKKTSKPAIITSDERYKMIEVAAYYIAEKNGFSHDHTSHWLQAEQEIDAKLNA